MADALPCSVRDEALDIDEVRLGKLSAGDFLQYFLQANVTSLMFLVKIHHLDAVIGIILQRVKLLLSVYEGIPYAVLDAFGIEICLSLPL